MTRSWNVADLFEVAAERLAGREALVWGATRLTYAELDARADRLARRLLEAGVGPSDRVACYLSNRPEYLETTLAAFKIGAVPVNVNYRYVAAELRQLLGDAAPKAVVYQRSYSPTLTEVLPHLPGTDVLIEVDDGGAGSPPSALRYEQAPGEQAPDPSGIRSPEQLYLLYTGGTTGMPKGVMWHHRDLVLGPLLGGKASVEDDPESWIARSTARRPSRVLVVPPLMHGAGQFAALLSLISGDTVILNPAAHFDAADVWSLAAGEAASLVVIVGDAMGRPLADTLPAARRHLDLSRCQAIFSSGASLSPTVKEALITSQPGLRVVDAYGASETGAQAKSVSDTEVGVGTSARFAIDEHTAVLDEDMRPVLPGSGTVGRLARRGHVAHGYWADAARTAETFPTVDGTVWAVTGDYATVEPDGTIAFLGRGAACINTGGEKVWPDEVEAALKTHADVFDTLVVGVPDHRFGERVVALVEPRPGIRPDPDDIAAHARTAVAGYKAPRAVILVDQIRRSPAGKPDYAWARNHALEALTGR